MCDFILADPDAWQGAAVLEVGAGVGLVSAVLSMFCAKLLSTDLHDDVLELLEQNLEQNRSEVAKVRVKMASMVKCCEYACAGFEV